jgi:hypothetical protein
MNTSDLIATPAAKQNLTDNQATDTINPVFPVEWNADGRSITGRRIC